MAYIDADSDRGPGRDAVELYTRTYGTLLRSSGETKLKVLEQSHIGMGSSLHPKAGSAEPDTGALIYALRRLPPSITAVRPRAPGRSPLMLSCFQPADSGIFSLVTISLVSQTWRRHVPLLYRSAPS